MISEYSILQMGLLFDYLPGWLGPTLVFFGIELVLVGVIDDTLPSIFSNWAQLNSREQLLTVSGLSIGPFILGSSVLHQYGGVQIYAALLFCIGRLIEGASGVLFYKKILHLIEYREFQGHTRQKFKHYLVLLFVVIASGWVAIQVWERGGYFAPQVTEIKLIWTLLTLFIATFGISYKLRFASGVLNKSTKLGFILCIGGAQIFNLQEILELATSAAGILAYTIGFWIAFVVLLKSERHRREPLFG